MASRSNFIDYIAALRAAIMQLHGCDAVHRRTVLVHEVVQGKTVWKGDVELFELMQHPKARRAYAWEHQEGDSDEDPVHYRAGTPTSLFSRNGGPGINRRGRQKRVTESRPPTEKSKGGCPVPESIGDGDHRDSGTFTREIEPPNTMRST